MKWEYHKNIRKLYNVEPDGYYQLTYYNFSYCRNGADLFLLLLEEIHNDFPELPISVFYILSFVYCQ